MGDRVALWEMYFIWETCPPPWKVLLYVAAMAVSGL